MTKVLDLRRKWMQAKTHRNMHSALTPEFARAKAVVQSLGIDDLTMERMIEHTETIRPAGARNVQHHRSRAQPPTRHRIR